MPLLLLLLSWCLMSSDVIWHIRDKLWPMPKHGSIRKVYACLAVTCHLHFWQNDRDFLRATVVTRGWNGYRNKSQHRKSTLEKKILPPFQQGFEPATFQSRVRCSNHWAIPAPPLLLLLLIAFIYRYSPASSRLMMPTSVITFTSGFHTAWSWKVVRICCTERDRLCRHLVAATWTFRSSLFMPATTLSMRFSMAIIWRTKTQAC